jgi:hypothetical protein
MGLGGGHVVAVPDRDGAALCAGLRSEFAREGGLADAGLAAKDDDVPSTCLGGSELLAEQHALRRPANDRRCWSHGTGRNADRARHLPAHRHVSGTVAGFSAY